MKNPRAPRVALLVLLAASCTVPAVQFPTWVPEAGRIVAIGDIHGDLEAARNALRVAGAIDENDHWVGGELVVVQTGDVLDRGDQELEIMDLFDALAHEAAEVGGAVYTLNGNHELMNAYQDFRYVTEVGWAQFKDTPLPEQPDSALLALEPSQRGRAMAFRPGQPMALRLAEHNTAIVVGSTVFAHGGVLPANVVLGLEEMNAEVRNWLLGEAPQPDWVRGDDSPVWNRVYSDEPTLEGCDVLTNVLDGLGLERMVVGHTVQRTGITAFCGGRVWAIDVGMAAHYGGTIEVLEIRGNTVRSLR
jgi:hypothetical protein